MKVCILLFRICVSQKSSANVLLDSARIHRITWPHDFSKISAFYTGNFDVSRRIVLCVKRVFCQVRIIRQP